MTTINELVYELWELRRGNIHETDPVTFRLLLDWIQTRRAQFLRRQFSRGGEIDDNLVQDLSNDGEPIALEKVVSNEVSPAISTGDFMYRTAITIPKTIDGKDGTGTFTRIGPASRLHHDFKVLTYDDALHFGHGKFNQNTICAFVLGDYVYLHSKSGYHFTVDYVNIRGVFQDPITAARIADPTWGYDDAYPINKSMIDDLKLAIVKEKFLITLAQAEDKRDDLEDNPEVDAAVQKRAKESTG